MAKPPQFIAAFFPLLLPVWQQQPLTTDDFVQPRAAQVAETKDVQFALDGMERLDPEANERLIRSLGKVESDNGIEALVGIAASHDDTTLKAAALAMLERHDSLPRTVAQPVYALLRHPEPNVRQTACRVLAKFSPNTQIAEHLMTLAETDPDRRVQTAALDALRTNHVQAIQRERLEPMLDHPDTTLRTKAWQAFLSAGAGKSSPVPDTTLAKGLADAAVQIRHALAENLHPRHGNAAWTTLDTLASAPATPVRAQAVESMARFPMDAANNRLIERLEDPDAEVRRKATGALQQFANLATVEALVQHLNDPSTFVRWKQRESLIHLNESLDVANVVARTLSADSADARESACIVLGRINARRHAPAILALLTTETRPLNLVAALEAMNRFEWQDARATVAGMAEHSDATVRRAVAGALGSIGNESTHAVLKKLMRDNNDDVRHAALTAAGRLADPAYAEDFIAALRDASSKKPTFSVADRMTAMWATARLNPPPENLVRLVHRHVTQPVIPTMMGPIFESEPVLVSGLFTLAETARRNPAARPLFQSAHTLLSRLPGDANNDANPRQLAPSQSLAVYAQQGLALFTQGTDAKLDPTPIPIPSRRIKLPYRPIE